MSNKNKLTAEDLMIVGAHKRVKKMHLAEIMGRGLTLCGLEYNYIAEAEDVLIEENRFNNECPRCAVLARVRGLTNDWGAVLAKMETYREALKAAQSKSDKKIVARNDKFWAEVWPRVLRALQSEGFPVKEFFRISDRSPYVNDKVLQRAEFMVTTESGETFTMLLSWSDQINEQRRGYLIAMAESGEAHSSENRPGLPYLD